MRFCVECNALTDDNGRAVSLADPSRLSRRFVEAPSAADAILSVVAGADSVVLGRIHHVADIQALATIRRGRSAMTLHAFPEEEAEWRAQGNGR